MRSFTDKYRYSPYISKQIDKPNIVISEWRLGLLGLIFSLIIIALKVCHANREYLEHLVYEREWRTYETIVTDGEVVVRHTWVTILRYSWFWLPILCGSLATWFTGLMVYIDSSVPGVQPPSPLSPAKYKVQSGHSFHLNYVFAVIVGLLVSSYMYIRGSALEL